MKDIVTALMLLLWVVTLVIYVISLREIFLYSRKTDLTVFGRHYAALQAMASDIYFLSHLWAGDEIDGHLDENLIEKLKVARRFFIFQMTLSVSIFFMLLLMASFGAK